jgi:hypothetical protein
MRKTPRGLNKPRSRSAAPPEAPATDAKDAVHAPVEEANNAAHEPIGGDADDVAHATELEAVLLAASSQHVKLTPKVQATPRLSPRRPPLPKLRSEGSRTRV